jgi:tetratricopeptide (TPR) repeat protein
MTSDNNITLSFNNAEDIRLIKEQLRIILASPFFRSAKQMKNFLNYVVSQTIKGEGGRLKQYTIAVDGLNAADDFNPDNNPLVRIIGGRVRARLKKYYRQYNARNKIIISIPKGGYVPEFKRIIDSSDVAKRHINSQGPKLSLVCFSDKTQAEDINRLLFRVSDNLAKKLSRFTFFRLVVAIPFVDKSESKKGISIIKAQYDPDYSLGLFLQQVTDKQYTLLYRLVDIQSKEVLWSESYAIGEGLSEPELEEISGKISSEIVGFQQGIMLPHWSREFLQNKKTIPAYHQILVYFHHYLDSLDKASFKNVLAVCYKALQENAEDIIANVIIASLCRRDYNYSYGVIKSPLESGKKHAETAIHLKPNSHEAHFVLGQLLFHLNEWQRCLDEFNIAGSIGQYHTVVEYGTGYYLCLMDKWEEGLARVKIAMDLMPYFPAYFHLVPFLDFYRQKKYNASLLEALKITTPFLFVGPLARCVCYGELGDMEKANKELEGILANYPDFMVKGQQYLIHFFGNEALVASLWNHVSKVYSQYKR